MKRFRQYLYGRSFTIQTDRRPLLTRFGPQHPVPAHAPARLQRWALILTSYINYAIKYRITTVHVDTDSISSLSLSQTWSPNGVEIPRASSKSDDQMRNPSRSSLISSVEFCH